MTIGLRVFAAVVLILSPALSKPETFNGWDVARFQEIADSPGRAWVDFDVEYPPGSLVLIRALASLDQSQNAVVTNHRILVATSLLMDLAISRLIWRRWRPESAVTYLVLGSPLVVFGLVRFDLWATLAAVLAGVLLAQPVCRPNREAQLRWPRALGADALIATAIVIGSLIKLWPALLIVVALSVGRLRVAILAILGGLGAGLVWLGSSGTDALNQVMSLRGATGWHVESIAGSITALVANEQSELQAGAYRIGTLNPELVWMGRGLLVVAALCFAWLGHRSTNPDRIGLIMLGITTALLLSSPLFSPQFLLWLLPWAAMTRSDHRLSFDHSPTNLLGLAVVLTVIIHAIAGPPNLDQTIPALGLLSRDLLLVGVIIRSAIALRIRDRPSRRPEDPLGPDRSRPWPTGAQA